MLEEEEKFQISVERTLRLLQWCTWILLGLSGAIGVALLFSLQISGNVIEYLVCIGGVCLFIVLLGYSTLNLDNSLRNLCFHLAIALVFLCLQLTSFIILLVNSSSLGKLFRPEALTVLDSYKLIVIAVLLATFIVTVILNYKCRELTCG
eukprot:TRINITY_DN3202_c0_g1_i6.p1 TRINITY_DN3202_c0_g1~~TRINITY_DN3202_c0_g1_i6.p1  ORF type:complete len:150 (+),score=22.43 TRINITY_DN3202_c0_g1_i6:147-596(+)